MKNKPHTEREECLTCNTIREKVPLVDMVSSMSKAWCIKCKSNQLHRTLKAPKNKTAVTFYIPEGMTFTECIKKSFRKKQEKEDPRCYYKGERQSQMFFASTAEQIQEAIDNTFPEKDAS